MTKKLVIFGTGDIGQLAHFYFTNDSPVEVVAFAADAARMESESLLGLPVVPFESVEEQYPPDRFDMFVALSYSKLNAVRAAKYDEAKAKGYTLASFVSTRSVLWPDLDIGDNCFIFENQTIQPFARIGNNVTLWSGNHIGHHSVIGDHCFLTSHVVISGHVTVEPYCFFGVNSAIRDGLTIRRGTVVGAGAMVVKDTVEHGVYMGTAAQLKSQESGKLDYFVNTSYQQRK